MFFPDEFTNCLSNRLNSEGINCSLKCKYNTFTKATKIVPRRYWNGKYVCNYPDCEMLYEAQIEIVKQDENVLLIVAYKAPCTHELKPRCVRIACFYVLETKIYLSLKFHRY